MRIAIFTNNYLPNPYGVTVSIETFRKDLESMGHTVYIFAPEFPGYVDTNPNVFRFPSLDIEFKIKFPLVIPYSRKINRILKNLDLDIIHAQHPVLSGTVARRWARKKKIPLIFTWHTLYDYYAHFAPVVPEKLACWWMIRGAKNMANAADTVVVPTDSIIPILKKWGVKNKMVPVATGVIEEEFQGADGIRVRKKYGIKEDEKVLLLVSRLTQEKNVEFVLKGVKNILKTGDGVKLMVVGDGDLFPKLKAYCQKEDIADKVIFTGLIKHEELKHYYAAADVFVYASKSETQGTVTTDAMYMGLPIVAVSAPGTNSLVLNNGNGFLVKEDEEEFEKAVLKLIKDEDLRKKFGEVSSRIARQNFTSQVCAKKLLEVYESQNH